MDQNVSARGKVPVMILCGGMGTRLREETDIRPKPTSELGQAARRLLRARLNCRKLREAGSGAFQGIDAGLDALEALEPMLLKR